MEDIKLDKKEFHPIPEHVIRPAKKLPPAFPDKAMDAVAPLLPMK